MSELTSTPAPHWSYNEIVQIPAHVTSVLLSCTGLVSSLIAIRAVPPLADSPVANSLPALNYITDTQACWTL